jgi:hypothetical protein
MFDVATKTMKLTLEERKESFTKLAWLTIGAELRKEFIEYWTEHSPNGKKMRFEMEKVFDIKRRHGTWIRNETKFIKPKNDFSTHVSKIETAYELALNKWKTEENGNSDTRPRLD